jgi:hypothetical protein
MKQKLRLLSIHQTTQAYNGHITLTLEAYDIQS